MASAALIPPIISGGVLGNYWHRFLEPSSQSYDGAIFGALWVTTAVIISHRSCQIQDSIDEDKKWLTRTLSISSFFLSLMSGVFWHVFLNEKCGLSIPDSLGGKMSAAAILGSRVLIPFFSPYKIW